MRPFRQFEVDFYVLNKAIHLNPAWIRAKALPTLTLPGIGFFCKVLVKKVKEVIYRHSLRQQFSTYNGLIF